MRLCEECGIPPALGDGLIQELSGFCTVEEVLGTVRREALSKAESERWSLDSGTPTHTLSE